MIDKKEAAKLAVELRDHFLYSFDHDNMEKVVSLGNYIAMLESNQKLLEETIENLINDVEDEYSDYGVDNL